MSDLSKTRVLIVEDEALVAAMLEDMLNELGATVVGPAATVSAGLILAQAGEIDAAVLDVNVRGNRIDPIVEVLRMRSVPLVFATGYGQLASDLAQSAPVLEKPYTKERLVAALRSALNAAKGLR